MKGKTKFIGPVFLVVTLLLAGCGAFSKNKNATTMQPDKVKATPADQKKAKLLKQLDSKFEDPDAHFELGQLYQADGLYSQAEYYYNNALSFNPAHRNAQAAMVKVLADSGDKAKSALTADIYINQVSASAEESLLLALAFQKQQLDDYALTCYRQALRLAPNSAKINRQIGYYYLSKNDRVLAQEYLTRSFQLNPNQPDVAGELGRMGVAVRIPQKTQAKTKKLDKIVEQSDKQR
jgi:tetratricopeptide (TPR) repeat protein